MSSGVCYPEGRKVSLDSKLAINRTMRETIHHRARRMVGRDPKEEHRAATSLEALFDLTFATCFGLAATQSAQELAAGRYRAALIGFGFASFAICWAWINFSWFSSAYDTDDWIFRITTMVQMIGVLVLATGLPRMFQSIEHSEHLDNSIMVSGYVIMRLAMVFQWLRAARQDAARGRTCLIYAIAISIAQVGWVMQIVMKTSVGETVLSTGILAIIEFSGPVVAELTEGGTPWHPHHIAERYSLFALIAFGEGVVATVEALSATVQMQGWSVDAGLICLAGIGLMFGMWWVYDLLPSAQVLHVHRDRAFLWGYVQIMIIVSIVATGAGLHAAAIFIARKSHIDSRATLLSVAVPVGTFLALSYALYYYLVRRSDRLHIWLLTITSAVVAGAVIAAITGVPIAFCLVILMLAPAITVIGYETWGHRQPAAPTIIDG
jgi:low temperature requirement protein LtrA